MNICLLFLSACSGEKLVRSFEHYVSSFSMVDGFSEGDTPHYYLISGLLV